MKLVYLLVLCVVTLSEVIEFIGKMTSASRRACILASFTLLRGHGRVLSSPASSLGGFMCLTSTSSFCGVAGVSPIVRVLVSHVVLEEPKSTSAQNER